MHLLISGYITGVLGVRELHEAGPSMSSTGEVAPSPGEGGELVTVCRMGLEVLVNSCHFICSVSSTVFHLSYCCY